ncbi:hypothetical protein WDV76_15615 [Xenorhabdus griffiniae]|uniref:hypothetical protein n=1 Tax=Xenorhabdus griffiniae TaxID=351672 RepID=UPI0030CC0E44
MVKNVIFLWVFIFTHNVYASEWSIGVRCFTNNDKKTINLKLVDMHSKRNNINIGYIKYEKSSKAIPIVFVKNDEVLSKTRPPISLTIWNEIFNGKVNGTYTIISQGEWYSGLIYKNKKGEETSFIENIDSFIETKTEEKGDCIWK